VNAGDVIPRLKRVRRTGRGWTAEAPCHDDRSNSLSVGIGGDGRVLLHCFAGCRQEAIVRAMGLELRDLFPGGICSATATRRPRQAPTAPLETARQDVLTEARRQLRRLEPYREAFAEADSIRLGHQVAAQARRVAAALGDQEPVWSLLEAAAALERATWAAELRLDEERAA
jgi:hypothetical protein